MELSADRRLACFDKTPEDGDAAGVPSDGVIDQVDRLDPAARNLCCIAGSAVVVLVVDPRRRRGPPQSNSSSVSTKTRKRVPKSGGSAK